MTMTLSNSTETKDPVPEVSNQHIETTITIDLNTFKQLVNDVSMLRSTLECTIERTSTLENEVLRLRATVKELREELSKNNEVLTTYSSNTEEQSDPITVPFVPLNLTQTESDIVNQVLHEENNSSTNCNIDFNSIPSFITPLRALQTFLLASKSGYNAPMVLQCYLCHHKLVPAELRSIVSLYYAEVEIISDTNIRGIVQKYYRDTKTQMLMKLRYGHISTWDTSRVTNMAFLFLDTSLKVPLLIRSEYFKHIESYPVDNLNINDWDVSNVIDMTGMFCNCSKFNQPLNKWKTRKVKSISAMFYKCSEFNQSLNAWDTSSVENMREIFEDCINFNQPLNNWNTSQVKDMNSIFAGCRRFNQPLNKWNTSKVKGMRAMFFRCSEFNQSLNAWDTSNVEDLSYMFNECKNFNEPLNDWNTSKCIEMNKVFLGAHSFNQPLNQWNVQQVKSMKSMFEHAFEFNQSLNAWDTSNVEDISYMFDGCGNFNGPLNDWNTSKCIEMNKVFLGAHSFNQPLNQWNVQQVKSMKSMFEHAFEFNQSLNAWNINTSNVNIDKMFRLARKFDASNISSWHVTSANTPTDNSVGFSDRIVIFDYERRKQSSIELYSGHGIRLTKWHLTIAPWFVLLLMVSLFITILGIFLIKIHVEGLLVLLTGGGLTFILSMMCIKSIRKNDV